MASVSQKTRILGALVVAGVLIGGSVFLSYGNLDFLNPSIANAASTQALLQELATRDSSGEGMPDWEVELYGLDPNNPHSFSPTITNVQAIEEGLVKPKFLTPSADSDSEDAISGDASSTDDADQLQGVTASPGSLTDQFAALMLQEYLSQSADAASNGEQPSEEDIDSAAQSALQQFALQNEHANVYSISQVRQGNSGPAALKVYAAAMEVTFAKGNPQTTDNELDYFADAVEKGDASALQDVGKIGLYYTSLAPAMMQISVPIEMQNAHLDTANAMARLGADITDMSMVTTDPLRAYFGLAQYQTDSEAMVKGMAEMGNVFSQEQVTIPEGQPGYYILHAANNAESAESQLEAQGESQ